VTDHEAAVLVVRVHPPGPMHQRGPAGGSVRFGEGCREQRLVVQMAQAQQRAGDLQQGPGAELLSEGSHVVQGQLGSQLARFGVAQACGEDPVDDLLAWKTDRVLRDGRGEVAVPPTPGRHDRALDPRHRGDLRHRDQKGIRRRH
jgi:hypothetical protein